MQNKECRGCHFEAKSGECLNRTEICERVVLDSRYWDCACADKYIHKHEVEFCSHCGERRDEMPDSRKMEVDQGIYFAED